MKIVLLALLGLLLGALGGAVLGIAAGLAWLEAFKTMNFEGYNGMLVFFTFMPLGAAIGGFGRRAGLRPDRLARCRDRHRTPAPPLPLTSRNRRICAMQKWRLRFGRIDLFSTFNSDMKCSIPARRR